MSLLLRNNHQQGWKHLRAVQQNRVYALDGNAYFARPGPRLVQGTGLMAKCLYPDLVLPERLAPVATAVRQITMEMYEKEEEEEEA